MNQEAVETLELPLLPRRGRAANWECIESQAVSPGDLGGSGTGFTLAVAAVHPRGGLVPL